MKCFKEYLVSGLTVFILNSVASACGLQDSNSDFWIEPTSQLQIKKCAVGATVTVIANHTYCMGQGTRFTWKQASEFPPDQGWRLPTKEDMQLLLRRSKGCQPDPLISWTSTAEADGEGVSWYYSLWEGQLNSIQGGGLQATVRFVRGASTAATSTRDDPKVRGRSARGG